MAGFISSQVARVFLQGLSDAGPEALPGTSSLRALLDRGEEAIPLPVYRAFLRSAYEIDDGRTLLSAAEPLRKLRHPLLFVLLNSSSPEVLIEKEARLAAFFHSRHRVEIAASEPRRLVLRHTGPPHEAPERSENLANCAVHAVLLEGIGCAGLRVCFPQGAEPERVVYQGGVLGTPPAGAVDTWEFRWEAFETRRPMEGLDDLLIRTAQEDTLEEIAPLVTDVERVVRADLGRTWRVGEVAQALGMSARTLQRGLGAVGERYSALVDRIRNLEAARLLKSDELSVTEIGYVCGFADGSHFHRAFKKRFGVGPAAFREGEGASG